ncbi:MAG: ChaN family lipoprotein [Bdellovibrionales bacterium]|nr:ChaN family lipoprotein [Bdellovibrionales bacterium]
MTRARKELQLLQRSIYASLQKEAASLLGRTPVGIRNYERTYRRELERLEKKAKPISMARLVSRARDADVLLIGDYHTYGQSQRAALRLLRELTLKIPPRDMVLGVECIASQHQHSLDQWLRGQISESQFLRAVQYDEAWGFPWENYRGLFHFARDHGMEIVALNRPRDLLPPLAAIPNAKRAGDLGARDEWAAGLVVDELLRPRARKMIAIYGEYHLSPSHMPASIREIARRNGLRPPELLVLHQNRDELFWKLAAKGLEQHASLIALEGNHLCVFSGTPWTKLQSLVNWIRGDLARFVDEDEGDAEEEFLQWMRIYGNGVSRFFQIPDANYSTLHLAKWEDLQGGPRWWKRLLQAQERFYLREDETSVLVYVASFSENAAAEVASVHLLHHDNPRKRPFRGTRSSAMDDFAASVLDHAFGFLGSLLINPRRKCDFPADHEARVRELRRNPKQALFAHELASRKLFLTLIARRRFERKALEKNLVGIAPETLFTTSRFLGHWLGSRLHESLLHGERTTEQVRLFFFERRRADAWLRLEELFGEFASKPRKKQSKRDSL